MVSDVNLHPYTALPVPDVNTRRTVNAYDSATRRLVSVWVANYTVLMTDLVPMEDPETGRLTYPTNEVEAMFAQLFPDDFRLGGVSDKPTTAIVRRHIMTECVQCARYNTTALCTWPVPVLVHHNIVVNKPGCDTSRSPLTSEASYPCLTTGRSTVCWTRGMTCTTCWCSDGR